MTTDQHFKLDVPDSSYSTSIHLGKAASGTPIGATTPFNNAGLSVNSKGRVWLDARGAPSSSTLSALSNDPNGQILLQAVGSAVLCVSKESNVVTSNGSIFLAGGKGVKMIAGHGAPLVFGIGEDLVSNPRPDTTDPRSNHAAKYTEHLDDVATSWTITNTVVAATLAALDVALLAAECCKGSKSPAADLGTMLLAASSAAKLAGGTADVCGMTGSELPGLNLHAFSNINFATTGFCSMYAGAGMLLFGGTTGGLGFVSASITGFVNASLKSVLMVGVEGKNVSLTGSRTLDLSAKAGPLSLAGPTVQIGASERADRAFSKTQMATHRITADAHVSLTARAVAKIGVASKVDGSTAYEGGTIDVDATKEVVIKSAGYEISVGVDAVRIAVRKKTKLTASADSVTFDAMGAQTLVVGPSGVRLGGKTVNLRVDAGGSVVWNAPMATFA